MSPFQVIDLHLLSIGMMRAHHWHGQIYEPRLYDIRLDELRQIILYCDLYSHWLKSRSIDHDRIKYIGDFSEKIAKTMLGRELSVPFEENELINHVEPSIRWIGRKILNLPIKHTNALMSYTQLDYIEQMRRIMFDTDQSEQQLDQENLHIYRIVRGCECKIRKTQKFSDGMDGIVRDITKTIVSNDELKNTQNLQSVSKKDRDEPER